jgi:hypothetical protein
VPNGGKGKGSRWRRTQRKGPKRLDGVMSLTSGMPCYLLGTGGGGVIQSLTRRKVQVNNQENVKGRRALKKKSIRCGENETP